jgi:2,4-dienoyl-CoA reductase-like NADH-dependent reductase (Old Yellow Enzyme family)
VSRQAAEYYAQRSTAGLIITEGVIVSPVAKGYSLTPGLYNDAHVEVWSEVTRRVHDTTPGSKIFVQLWHVGRVSHPDIAGEAPLAPSALRPPAAKVWIERANGWQDAIECGEPREMSRADKTAPVEGLRNAAPRAGKAGV